MDDVPSLRVPQRYAQLYRRHLQTQGVLDLRYCLQKHSDGTVTLPVLPSILPLLDLRTLQCTVAPGSICEIVQNQVPRRSKRERTKSCGDKLVEFVQELLESHGESWNEMLQKDLPQSWHRHGDLILFAEDCFSHEIWEKMGFELWLAVARGLDVKRLARIRRISRDGFRTPEVVMVLGEDSYVTHIDNRIRYEFDVTKCMFSFGNITEKLRIASFNCSGETVVDLYAGIGYFTLPYLVHAGAARVHACEWNPDAVDALHRNLCLNGVSDRCTVHHGDNRQLPLHDLADRVNLGLIPSSEEGWPVACRLLKKGTGGMLHIHQNVTSPPPHHTDLKDCFTMAMHRPSMSAVEQEMEVLKESPQGSHKDREVWRVWADDTASRIATLFRNITGGPWRTHIQHIEHIKSYAPHIHHIVLDLECKPF